jgi:DNA repair exonuclease SbcCD ATPase subunit
MLSEKLSQAKSNNYKLKEEVISFREEIHKRRKVDDEARPLRTTILNQHEKLYDVRMECFDKVKKMADKVKMIEKHLDIISQTHQRMRNLQEKVIELNEWRSTEKDIPSSLPSVKSYDITFYSMATKECQDLASRFEENARKDIVGMMELYEKSINDIQKYIQFPEIDFEEDHPVPITMFKQIEKGFEKVKAEVQVKKNFSMEDI